MLKGLKRWVNPSALLRYEFASLSRIGGRENLELKPAPFLGLRRAIKKRREFLCFGYWWGRGIEPAVILPESVQRSYEVLLKV